MVAEDLEDFNDFMCLVSEFMVIRWDNFVFLAFKQRDYNSQKVFSQLIAKTH